MFPDVVGRQYANQTLELVLKEVLIVRRKDFLRLTAAVAALQPTGAVAQQVAPAQDEQPFPVRVIENYAAALTCALCYVGDELGLFKAMAQSGPVTAADLARRTRVNARMLREWLNGMAAARYLAYRPEEQTYLLSPEHAAVLADEDSSPLFRGGLFVFLMSVYSAAPDVARMFQTGKPAHFRPEGALAGERSFAVAYRHQLVQHWLPLLPRVQATLIEGGRALDFACGGGVAVAVLAKAFPKAAFAGYDPDARAISRARARAKREGIDHRVEFVAGDATKLPRGQYHLVTILYSMHHFNDPVAILRHCREALTPGGTCLIVDMDLSAKPEENIHLAGQITYAVTTLSCLQDSLTGDGVGLGAELNEGVLRQLAQKSGFSSCRKLPGSTPAQALFALDA